jgi:DNA anti-recombination protein RmuC
MTADAKGQPLDEYCRSKSVIAVSPNTLYAHLQVILMGLQGMQIEENAKRLHASLAGMQKQMENFAEVFEKLGTHLKNAQQSYGEADKRFEKTYTTLEGMLGAGAPDSALASAVEPAQGTLALPAETAAEKTA